MTQQHSLPISDLKPLLEQLSAGQQGLKQLLDMLSGLTIRIDLPADDGADLECHLAGQEIIIRRKADHGDDEPDTSAVVIAHDAKMRIAAGLARSMAETDDAVLLCGATGTGKSLLSRVIHHHGPRSDSPLVKAPCGLFNEPAGALQMADFIAEAGTGTLVLDDVEDLEPAAQMALLQQLQRPLDCRLVSLTRIDPDQLTGHGGFSSALLGRLRDCYIALPDLCQRRHDIEQLAEFYCARLCLAQGLVSKQLSSEYLDLLCMYPWPGNVRELINTIKQSLLSARHQKTVFVRDLPAHIRIQTLHLSSARKKGL